VALETSQKWGRVLRKEKVNNDSTNEEPRLFPYFEFGVPKLRF